MFAVIKTGGKQYLVKSGDKLRVEKLPQAEVGSPRSAQVEAGKKVIFDKVLLIADDKGAVTLGKPYLAKAKVEATLLRTFKDKKVRVVKYKAKTRYKRVIGHRQQKAEVKIDKIVS